VAFAERIKLARKALDLTQEGLAEALGISHVSIYNWETGDRSPSKANLQKIATLLGKPVAWFFEDHLQPLEAVARPENNTEQRLLAMLERQQDLLSEQLVLAEKQRQDIANLTDAIKVQQMAFLQEREFQQKLSNRRDETIDELRAEVDALKAQLRTTSRSRQQLLDPPVRPGRTGAS
jgi:transcriptional regulator with XRE-family HTH domain